MGKPPSSGSTKMKDAAPRKKRKRSSISRKKKPKVVVEEEIDVEIYEMENILAHKFVGDQLFYKIKWENYGDEDNSWEHEKRVMSPELLLKYSKSLWSTQKNDEIDNLMIEVENISNDDICILSNFALCFIHFGSIQYMFKDSIENKKLLLKALQRHDQEWVLKTIYGCSMEDLYNDMKRYNFELNYRIQSSHNYPAVEVSIPRTTLDRFTPPPPPQSNLVLDTINVETLKEKRKNNTIIKKSSILAFDSVQIFGHRDFFKNIDDQENDMRYEHILNSKVPTRYQSRFTTNFKLIRPENELGWVLVASQLIQPGTLLMKMGGVICRVQTAEKSFIEDGRAFALSSFIELGNSGYCLDRRRYYDFSRFIKHDCNPNCDARLVESESGIPDILIYSKLPIARNSSQQLTLDYYKGFKDEVDSFFEDINDPLLEVEYGQMHYLLENNIDFVLCTCGSADCRMILWVDQSTVKSKLKANAASKKDHKFHGMTIASKPATSFIQFLRELSIFQVQKRPAIRITND